MEPSPDQINVLLRRYPRARVTSVVQPLSATDFEAQKHKHLSRQALGGAVGVVSMANGQIILVKRSGMHVGWALPGGTVEQDEDFQEAFIREIVEEIGVSLRDTELVEIERKLFVSPTQEKLDFVLTVFTANANEDVLPQPTPDAESEGLTVSLFRREEFPTTMILGDKQKALAYAP